MRGGMGMGSMGMGRKTTPRGASLCFAFLLLLAFTFRSSPSALSSSMKGAVKASELRVR